MLTRLLARGAGVSSAATATTAATTTRLPLQTKSLWLQSRAAVTLNVVNKEQQQATSHGWASKRPVAPSLTVYKMPAAALTGVVTGRIAGVVSAAGFYGIVLADSAGMNVDAFVSLVHSFPLVLPLVKFAVAAPIVSHYIAGLRHLRWDGTGKGVTVQGVTQTGYLTLAATVAIAAGLATVSF